MAWLTWRQHRAETLAVGLIVIALALLLLAFGLPMHAMFNDSIAPCLVPGAEQTCGDARTLFLQKYGTTTGSLALLTAVPFAIGGFLGAPLIARELESNTLQLAWTQGVPRMRWLAIKLTSLAAVTIILSGAFSAVVTWFRHPLDDLYGPFAPGGFDIEWLMLPAHALFAFALATAASVLLRRSLPALGAGSGPSSTSRRLYSLAWLSPCSPSSSGGQSDAPCDIHRHLMHRSGRRAEPMMWAPTPSIDGSASVSRMARSRSVGFVIRRSRSSSSQPNPRPTGVGCQ